MLADAIAAEGYKLLRNRGVLFWGFCFAPLANLLFNLGTSTWLFLHGTGAALRLAQAAGARPDLGAQLLQGLGSSTSFFFEIFTIAGASALFAGEYRWETWRLLVPRNSRTNLLLAKFAVFAMAAAASVLAFGVFAARAQMAALIGGIFFVIAQAIGMGIAHPWEAPVQDFAYLPAMSAYLIRAWAAGQQIAPGVFADPAKLLPACLFLLVWIGVLGGFAIAFSGDRICPGNRVRKSRISGQKTGFSAGDFFALLPPFWYVFLLESWRPFAGIQGPFQNTRIGVFGREFAARGRSVSGGLGP